MTTTPSATPIQWENYVDVAAVWLNNILESYAENENLVPVVLISIYFLWTAWRLFRSLLTPSVVIAVGGVVAGLLAMNLQWMTPAVASLGICGANSFVPKRSSSSSDKQRRRTWTLVRFFTVVLSISLDGTAMFHLGIATPRRVVFLIVGSLFGLSVLPLLRIVDRLFQLSFYLGVVLAIIALCTLIGGGRLALKDEL